MHARHLPSVVEEASKDNHEFSRLVLDKHGTVPTARGGRACRRLAVRAHLRPLCRRPPPLPVPARLGARCRSNVESAFARGSCTRHQTRTAPACPPSLAPVQAQPGAHSVLSARHCTRAETKSPRPRPCRCAAGTGRRTPGICARHSIRRQRAETSGPRPPRGPLHAVAP